MKFGKLLFVVFSFSIFANADVPSVHGMLLFGQVKQYVSHLPMFHPPHDYQAIAEVTLTPEGTAAYLKDAGEQPGDTIYTIVPEKFSLPDRFQSGKSFKVTVFRGHFERGGTALFPSTVTLKKVLHFRKLDHHAAHSAKQSLIAFGVPIEIFSAHLIGGSPDFDQIAQVSNVKLSSNPLLLNSLASNDEPLQAGQSVSFNPGTRLFGTLNVVRSIYVEFDDLSH